MSRLPCPSCPWRVEQTPDTIPGFRVELAERLARTSRRDGYGPEITDPQFACHHSRPGEEIVCRGWLAVEGHAHPQVRIAVAFGDLDPDALEPGDGWPELHGSFPELIEKLRRENR